MSAVDTELDLLVFESLEFEPPCGVGDCGRPAKWAWLCPRCRHSQLLCTPHAEGLKAKRARYGGECVCRKCGHRYRAEDSPIEPIK